MIKTSLQFFLERVKKFCMLQYRSLGKDHVSASQCSTTLKVRNLLGYNIRKFIG